MTDQQHPITPPPELQKQWKQEWLAVRPFTTPYHEWVATQAARWGADTALDACCDYLAQCAAWEPEDVREMLNFVCLKPKSQAEEALETLQQLSVSGYPCDYQGDENWDIIRRALERLQELEKS